jgi:serine/threonine protein kinase
MINASRSNFKKKTVGYYKDNIFDIIDISEQIDKNKEITKCHETLFLYNLIKEEEKAELTNWSQLEEIEYETNNGRIIRLKDEFTIHKILGKGSFGIVLSVYDKTLDCKAALKIARKEEVDSSEILNQAQISHKNIIQLFRAFENEDYLFMVMELMEGGSLQDLIEQRYRNKDLQFFNEEEISLIMKGIIEGLEYMHLKNMFHRDIKPGIIV